MKLLGRRGKTETRWRSRTKGLPGKKIGNRKVDDGL